jgi:hypothetical protein
MIELLWNRKNSLTQRAYRLLCLLAQLAHFALVLYDVNFVL